MGVSMLVALIGYDQTQPHRFLTNFQASAGVIAIGLNAACAAANTLLAGALSLDGLRAGLEMTGLVWTYRRIVF